MTLASFPVPSVNDRFRMGPNFTETPGDDYWWNYLWPDGTLTACGEPAGWESLDYITPFDQVGGRDGAMSGPQSIAPRDLECEALIVASSPQLLRQHIAMVRRVLGPQGLPGPRQPIVWEQHDYGTNRRLAMITRPDGAARFQVVPGVQEGGLAAVVTFKLTAGIPWRYQSGGTEGRQDGLPNPALVTGRTYNKTYNYTYGAGTGAVGGEFTVVNAGDLPTEVIFTVTGPVDYPIISNVTTGLSFQVNWNLSSTDVITIDGRTGVVTPASARLIGRPFLLRPGENTIRWRSLSGTYYPAALLRLDWRSKSR